MKSVDHLIDIGDWVSGTTVKDEKFIGFVDAADDFAYRVFVTQSDHEGIIGKRIGARSSRVHKLSVHQPETIAEIKNLIELTLMTRDEDWFTELVSRLETGENHQPKLSSMTPIHRFAMND